VFSRAGTDPEILPAGAFHAGVSTLAPGGTARLVAEEGSGTIRAVTVGLTPADDSAMHDVWFEARWDGLATPDVAAPLADLFLTGAGERAPALGLLAGYRPQSHNGYLYFPMPFASRAELRLVNRGTRPITAAWQVQQSPEIYPGIGTTVGEFHASYADNPATANGSDYVFLDTPGQGRVVGISFTESGPYSSTLPIFMEGDERISADGSQTPQIYGTGTEDFFNGGFYYANGPFTMPTHGATTKEAAPEGGRTSQYRLFLGDSWSFRDHLLATIEHGAGDGTTTAAHSVTFWYGTTTPSLHQTDRLEVTSAASQARHGYIAPSSTAYALAGFYEGDRDGDISPPDNLDFPYGAVMPPPGTDPMHESVNDSGRQHTPGSTIDFTIATDPTNHGVILRRRLDQLTFGQRAAVTIDSTPLGIWLTAGVNNLKRYADSDFFIPASVSAGHSTLHVHLDILSPEPAAPAGANSGWTDFDYLALSQTFGGSS
jgi:hypothetical protein